MPSLFPLGQLLITAAANATLAPEDVYDGLIRHANGEWGDLDDEDRQSNEDALRTGQRLLSAYRDRNGVKFWIITEWDRSVTTVLLPDDY